MIQHNDITIEPTATPFSTLAFAPAVLTNLVQSGYTDMTLIQAASLPITLAGHDLIAQTKTGSGRTAAFAPVLLVRLDACSLDVQAMVFYPACESADQVAQETRRLTRVEENVKALTLCGDTPMRPQAASLEHGVHVIVGTPECIMDHLERGNLELGALKMLALDEADRMFDVGFFDGTVTVVRQCPADRQTLLLSATYSGGIVKPSQRILRNPKEVKLEERHDDSKIRQRFYEVTDSQRLHAMGQLLRHYRSASTFAFCNMKQQRQDLLDVLCVQGIRAPVLHGRLEQRERDQVLIQFANRNCSVLVATDVVARGLDIAQLEIVTNVDVTPDPEMRMHRTGRTGRAGENGRALSLVSMDEMGCADNIEQVLGREVEWHKLDELDTGNDALLLPPMETLQILGECREKIRPGDVFGAPTEDADFRGGQIGEINVTELPTHAAVERGTARKVPRRFNAGTMKGKKVRVRLMNERHPYLAQLPAGAHRERTIQPNMAAVASAVVQNATTISGGVFHCVSSRNAVTETVTSLHDCAVPVQAGA